VSFEISNNAIVVPQPDPLYSAPAALEPILFSQIFTGIPQFYAGSSFTVEEIYEIGLSNQVPELLDVDFRWNPPRKYYGTYCFSDTISGLGIEPENRGFLDNDVVKIKRYSSYTVQANAGVAVAINEFLRIDNCNFVLNTLGANVGIFEAGQQYLDVNDSIFIGRQSLTKVPLIDQVFTQKIGWIYCYINPGNSIEYATYKVRVVNAISVDLENFPSSVCNIVPQESCDGLFQIAASTGLLGADPSSVFATQALAQAAADASGLQPGQYQVFSAVWSCPIAPFTQVTYWIFAILNT
jgi:hypothetical protein